MMFIRLALCTLAFTSLGSGCGPRDGAELSEPTSDASSFAPERKTKVVKPGKPPVILGTPQWLPLTGQEIDGAFSGQHLTIDENYEIAPGLKPQLLFIGGCLPRESFHPDGTWKAYFCFRGPRTYEGTWSVEKFRGGEHLCVQAQDFPKNCRFVWRGRTSEHLFLPASLSTSTKTENDRFNPYRLVPINIPE